MEKKIIVPVDFSAASKNAYNYALQLAEKQNANIEVIYVINELPSSKDILPSEFFEQTQTTLNDFISQDSVSGSLEGGVAVSSKVNVQLLKGDPVKEIIQFSKKMDNPVIVMGSTGSHNAVEKVFGSVSSKVAQRANCPVLLIPKSYQYVDYANILYATNFESIYSKLIDQMLTFVRPFTAVLHFIQCRKPGQPMKYKSTEDRIKSQLSKKGSLDFPVTIKTIEAESILKGLNEYAAKEKVDLIIIANIERGFLESISGRSMTKKMALNPAVPLMVYHL